MPLFLFLNLDNLAISSKNIFFYNIDLLLVFPLNVKGILVTIIS